jgi:hypothetical protein
MGNLITFNDIGSQQDKPYSNHKVATSCIPSRILKVFGQGANPQDYHAVKNTHGKFVIRHKLVQVINRLTIEPFYQYGVEYVAVNEKDPVKLAKRTVFGTMKEALHYVHNHQYTRIQATKERIANSALPSKDEAQKADLGSSIFDLTNTDMVATRKELSLAVKSQDASAISQAEAKVKKMRHEIWVAEEMAEKAWREKDPSSYIDSIYFPTLNAAMRGFLSMKRAG